MKMRLFILAAIAVPSLACGADWVELGKTREARVLLDRASVETLDGDAKARLKFLYYRTQPAQTISRGSPFDSSINLYYLACGKNKYQVLDLTMFYRNEAVGAFHQSLHRDGLDQAGPDTGVMLLFDRICPAKNRGAPGTN